MFDDQPPSTDRTVPDTGSFLAASPRELRPRAANRFAAKLALLGLVIVIVVLVIAS